MAEGQTLGDREAAERAAARIAALLKEKLGADGPNLTARVEAAGAAVPADIGAKIRFIETNLNLLESQDNASLSNRVAFEHMAEEVIAFLTGPVQPVVRGAAYAPPPPSRRTSPAKIVAMVLLALAAILLAIAVWGISRVG